MLFVDALCDALGCIGGYSLLQKNAKNFKISNSLFYKHGLRDYNKFKNYINNLINNLKNFVFVFS